jgi:hypothetical protein
MKLWEEHCIVLIFLIHGAFGSTILWDSLKGVLLYKNVPTYEKSRIVNLKKVVGSFFLQTVLGIKSRASLAC